MVIFHTYVSLPEGLKKWLMVDVTYDQLTGWRLSYPTPLKNDGVRQLGLLFPTYGKIKNVQNHQPDE